MAISLKVGHHYRDGFGDTVVIIEDIADGSDDPFRGVELREGLPGDQSWWRPNGMYFVRQLLGAVSKSDLIEDLGPYEGGRHCAMNTFENLAGRTVRLRNGAFALVTRLNDTAARWEGKIGSRFTSWELSGRWVRDGVGYENPCDIVGVLLEPVQWTTLRAIPAHRLVASHEC